MQVILLEKIRNVGDLGETVKVKAGFARNYLFPKQIAVPATKENVAGFESRKAELEKAAAEKLAQAEVRKEKIAALSIKIEARSSEEGKLFGSVTNHDVSEQIEKANIEIHRSEIIMPKGAIRHIGVHPVTIILHSDVQFDIDVEIVPEA